MSRGRLDVTKTKEEDKTDRDQLLRVDEKRKTVGAGIRGFGSFSL